MNENLPDVESDGTAIGLYSKCTGFWFGRGFSSSMYPSKFFL